MSLSGVFDNTNASDLLKSLINILNEHEQSKDVDYKPKMVGIPNNQTVRIRLTSTVQTEVLQIRQEAPARDERYE